MQLYQAAYAGALLEIAAEDGIEDSIYEQLKETAELAKQSPELSEVLSSPVFSEDERIDVITALFSGKTHPVFVNFLCVLAEEGRGGDLEGIAEEFRRMYYDMKGIAEAVVTTAIPMDDQTRSRLRAKLEGRYQKKILLSERVDPDIIGGVCIRVGDDMIDGTVRTKLEKAKREI